MATKKPSPAKKTASNTTGAPTAAQRLSVGRTFQNLTDELRRIEATARHESDPRESSRAIAAALASAFDELAKTARAA